VNVLDLENKMFPLRVRFYNELVSRIVTKEVTSLPICIQWSSMTLLCVVRLEGPLYQRVDSFYSNVHLPIDHQLDKFVDGKSIFCSSITFNVPVKVRGGEDYLIVDTDKKQLLARPGYVLRYKIFEDIHTILVFKY
jgi:hypothetical protein